MDYSAWLEEFLADWQKRKSNTTEATITRMRTRIGKSIKHFVSKGITSPIEADYEEYRAYLLTLPGQKKGTTQSPATVDDWINRTKDFYDFLKGEQQMSLGDVLQEKKQAEPVEEIRAEFKSEGETLETNHGVSTESEAVEIQEVTTEKKEDTGSLSPVDTPNVQPHDTPAQPKNKGGRKVLSVTGEKRSEKVMLYLTPSLYVDVKDWASLHGKSITDCILSVLEEYMQGKQGKLALFRELRDNE